MSAKPPVRLDKIPDDKIKINKNKNENMMIAYDGSYDAIEPPIKDWKNLLSKNKLGTGFGTSIGDSRLRNNQLAIQSVSNTPQTITNLAGLSMVNSGSNFYSPAATNAISLMSPNNANKRASPPSYTSMKVLHNKERLKRLKKLASAMTDQVPSQILRGTHLLTP